MGSSVPKCEPQEPSRKKQKTDQKTGQSTVKPQPSTAAHASHDPLEFEQFMLDLEQNSHAYPQKPDDHSPLEDEIDQALKSFMAFNHNGPGSEEARLMSNPTEAQEIPKFTDLSSTASPINQSTFDSPHTLTNASVSSNEEETSKAKATGNKEIPDKPSQQPHAIASTVTAIKRSMTDTSKFISTFTTLKTTYLKLCKEFNYLLSKFNDNERIKIELIHENNELKSLLMKIIKERELERKSQRENDIRDSRKRPVSATA